MSALRHSSYFSLWQVIVLIAVPFLALGVGLVAWAGVHRLQSPERALAAAPWDARAKSTLGAQMVIQDPSLEAVRRASALAAMSLQRQPVDPVAIRLVASLRDVEGRRAEALSLMLGAQKLSRRELLTQLWLIQHFSQTDDVERVLHHYEIALTGSNQSFPILFPVLVAATDDRQMVGPIAKLLQRSRNRQWRGPLLNEIIANGKVGSTVAELAFSVLDASRADDQVLYRALVRRLTDLGALDLGFEAYRRATRDSGSVGTLRDPGFRSANRVPPFDWDLTQEVDHSASPIGGRVSGLQIAANGGASGVLARQLVRLSPGDHQLSFDLMLNGSPATGLAFIVSCAPTPGQGAAVVHRAQIPPRSGKHRVTITATPRCLWHMLEIAYEGASDGEFSATLTGLELQQIAAVRQ